MGADAISAQGTLIARQVLGAGSFTTIGELHSITVAAVMRNEIDMTAHNDSEETFVMGIRRKQSMTFEIGFVPTLGSHDHRTGLLKAIEDNSRDVYRVTYPEGSTVMFSGYVSQLAVKAPVDGALTADVTIRPTGHSTYTPV